MRNHEDEIPEISSSPHEVGDVDSTHVYDPSLEISSYSGYDPSVTGHRYWMPGDETHHEPASTSYVSYGMSGIPAHDPAHHVES